MYILLVTNLLPLKTKSVEGDAYHSLKWNFQIVLVPFRRLKPINAIINNTVWDHAPPMRL